MATVKEQIRYLNDMAGNLELFAGIGEQRETLLEEIIEAEACDVGRGILTVRLSGDEKERFTDLARAELERKRRNHEELQRHVQVFMAYTSTIDY